MIKKLMQSIGEYKKESIQVPIYIALEVVMECIIPFIIARLVNKMKTGCGMDIIVQHGIICPQVAGYS